MNSSQDSDTRTRSDLAWLVVGISVLGIIAFSILAIALAANKDRQETAKLVFGSVLPLFGAWVGTVLAFYFARDNLRAATESTLRLTAPLRADTSVAQVMIPKASIVSYDLTGTEKAEDVAVSALLAKMTPDRQRVPIFTVSQAVAYVVHRSTLDSFAAAVGKQPDQLTEKISDLQTKPELASAISALAFVTATGVLADARSAMAAVPGCNDVFVTASGKQTDAVIGWLTNTDLAALA